MLLVAPSPHAGIVRVVPVLPVRGERLTRDRRAAPAPGGQGGAEAPRPTPMRGRVCRGGTMNTSTRHPRRFESRHAFGSLNRSYSGSMRSMRLRFERWRGSERW